MEALLVRLHRRGAGRHDDCYQKGRHAFPVTPGGTLSANITGLTEAGQQLARWALESWLILRALPVLNTRTFCTATNTPILCKVMPEIESKSLSYRAILVVVTTSYIDPDFTKNLLSLFVPGSGALPPVLAGRDGDLRVLQGFLQRLLSNRQVPADAVIYGPRGNGKTVLLETFRRQCEVQDTDTLDLTPAEIGNVTDLASHLLYDDSVIGKFLTSITPSGLSIDLQAIGARWDSMTPDQMDNIKRRHLVQMLVARCRKRPLVVALDEAHTLAAEVGHTLLNASQQVRKQGAPFLLVIAGTPNLRDHLNQMSATFWNRAEKIGIGRLSLEATVEALVSPLAEADIIFDEDALDRVVQESQRYPYFIQLWGEALCHAMVGIMHFRVQAGIIDAARPRFEASKTAYYGDRFRELRKQGLLQAAGAVAGVFAGQETASSMELADHLVALTGVAAQTADTQLDQLANLGYIWQPAGDDLCEPGIPSLMTYVQTELAASRRAAAFASQQTAQNSEGVPEQVTSPSKS